MLGGCFLTVIPQLSSKSITEHFCASHGISEESGFGCRLQLENWEMQADVEGLSNSEFFLNTSVLNTLDGPVTSAVSNNDETCQSATTDPLLLVPHSCPFECSYCGYQCDKGEDIREHVLGVHSQMLQHDCPECHNFRGFIKDVARHRAGAHNAAEYAVFMEMRNSISEDSLSEKYFNGTYLEMMKVYECSECEFKETIWPDLRKHLAKNHNKTVYACELCDYKANLLTNLRVHHAKNHNSITPFQCLWCDYKSSCEFVLIDHANKKHEVPRPYKCSLCEFKTGIYPRLSGHLLTHVPGREAKKKPTYLSEMMGIGEYDLMTRNKQFYRCPLCKFRSRVKANLRKHISGKHRGRWNYTCTFCKARMGTRTELKEHVALNHDNRCNLCEYSTPVLAELSDHIDRYHQSFHFMDGGDHSSNGSVNGGIQKPVYNGRVVRNDNNCIFNNALCLELTRGIEDTVKDKRPLQCLMCGYKTRSDHKMRTHLCSEHIGSVAEETEMKCPCCRSVFDKYDALKTHMFFTHVKEMGKRFRPCPYCDFKADRFHVLNEHVSQEHPGCKPYKCKYCKFSGYVPYNVKDHMIRVHGTDK